MASALVRVLRARELRVGWEGFLGGGVVVVDQFWRFFMYACGADTVHGGGLGVSSGSLQCRARSRVHFYALPRMGPCCGGGGGRDKRTNVVAGGVPDGA